MRGATCKLFTSCRAYLGRCDGGKLVRGALALGLGQAVQGIEFDYGARACVDLHDEGARRVFLHGSFWPEFAQIVAAFMCRGGVMFDVGANFGLCSFGIVPLVPNVPFECHLFEANPAIEPVLRRSVALQPHGHFEVVSGCVTDQPGMSRFSLPDAEHWGLGLIGDAGIPVPNVILDDYVNNHRIKTVTFLKMDIEGWEPFALQGASRTLAEGRVESLFAEVVGSQLARAGVTPESLVAMMERWGFDAYFCGLWMPPGYSWFSAPVNDNEVQFAPVPRPVPGNLRGDILFLHQASAVADQVRRSATGPNV